MRKTTFIFLLVLLCTAVVPAVAQTRIAADPSMRDLSSSNHRFTRRDKHRQADSRGLIRSKETNEAHLFGVYALGGYSSTLSTTKALGIRPGGYDARAGVVYEYRKGFFMLQTGLAAAWRQVSVDVSDVTYTNTDLARTEPLWTTIVDSWDMPLASLYYQVTDRRDRLRQFSVQIPVLAGYHVRGFYVAGGLTFTMPIMQKASANMNVTTRGSYDRYYGIGDQQQWMEMDNHGYRERVPMQRELNDSKRRLDMLLTLETGYEHRLKNDMLLRMGLYADMGLLNFSPRSDAPALNIPYATKWDFATFGATPVWFSDLTRNAWLGNFTAGLKLSVLFTVRQKERCILCGSTRPNRHYR